MPDIGFPGTVLRARGRAMFVVAACLAASAAGCASGKIVLRPVPRSPLVEEFD